MAKILTQSGASLADIYNVQGSIAGIDELVSNDVSLVHEMGAEILSERIITNMVIIATASNLQNVTFGITIPANNIPDTVNRLLAIVVLSTASARLSICSLAIRNVITGRELPIWVWNSTDDPERAVEWSLDGAASATFVQAAAPTDMLPYLITRTGLDRRMPDFVFRGATLGFGAGNVTTRCVLAIARGSAPNPTPGEPGGHGLPIPSW